VGIFGFHTTGGYAEYVTAPVSQVYPKPKNISFVEAAAFPLTFLTAWRMLTTKAKLKNKETVFIWGASGGLGLAGLIISKYLGARVIAAARTVSIAKKLKALGADEAIVYPQGRVVDQVMSLTNQKGVNVVFETVGKKTWPDTIKVLAFGGRVVIAGTTSGDMGSQDLSEVYYRQLTIHGSRMGNKQEFEQVLKLVSRKKLKPVIDKVYPLKDARKALEKMDQGKHLGKIVLKI
jgi:NADPH:quinone reductase-like Zn-dependent oxidoreductase